MAEGFVNLTGADELHKRLNALEEKMAQTIARKAARRGAIVIRDAARANFVAQKIDDAKTANNIAKNIAVQQSRRQSQAEGGIVMRVGIMGGARQYAGTRHNVRKQRVGQTYAVGGTLAKVGGGPGGDTFYWRFHEFGARGGKLKARPFMRPAFSQKAQAAIDAVAADLARQLDNLAP